MPAVEIVAAPELGPADAARVEAERRRLDAHPAMFDGPILMVRGRLRPTGSRSTRRRTPGTRPTAPSRSRARTARWACSSRWSARTARSCGSAAPTPSTIPAGGRSASPAPRCPGVALERQIVAEAEEELGLARADLLGLEPLALVDDRRGRTVQVVFRARPLAVGADRAAAGVEVAEIRLAAAYPGDGPAESITAAWWPEPGPARDRGRVEFPQMDDFYRENILDHYKNPAQRAGISSTPRPPPRA